MDVYYVSEDLHQCARAMLGEGDAARSWAETELAELIRISGPQYIERLEHGIASTTEPRQLEALETLRVYLEGNRDRMWYADRLKQGKVQNRPVEVEATATLVSDLQDNHASTAPATNDGITALPPGAPAAQ